MGKCCSKKSNINSETVTGKPQEDVIIVNNQDNTFERIKIKKQGADSVDLNGTDREIVRSNREEKGDMEEELLLIKNSKDKFIDKDESLYKKSNQVEKKLLKIESDIDSVIKLADNYETNDADLKTIVDIINEKDILWEKILEDNICKIQRKQMLDLPPMMRTSAIIEGFSAKEIFDAIAIISNRLEWDKSFDKFDIVEQNLNEGWEILYMIFKVQIMN